MHCPDQSQAQETENQVSAGLSDDLGTLAFPQKTY